MPDSTSEVSPELNETEEAETAKALDADSSNDLQAFITHNNVKSNSTSAKPQPTEETQTPSMKRSSKRQPAVTRPLSATVTRQPVESLITNDESSNNGSFLQASLGEINPTVPDRGQVSSVDSEISPDTTSMPGTGDEENTAPEKVRIEKIGEHCLIVGLKDERWLFQNSQVPGGLYLLSPQEGGLGEGGGVGGLMERRRWSSGGGGWC